jgi:hypothetical protein
MILIIVVLTGTVAAIVTFHASEKWNLGPVRASAVLSLAVGLLFHFLDQHLQHALQGQIPLVFIGGSFVGMVSSKVMPRYGLVGLAGFFFSMLYLYAPSFFHGYGGALGTAACTALVFVLGLQYLLRYVNITVKKES